MSAQGKERQRLFYAQKGKCFYCGDPMLLDKAGHHRPGSIHDYICTIDHVIPLAKGGYGGIYNKIACCSACNAHKGNRSPTKEEIKRARVIQEIAATRTRKELKREMDAGI